MDKFIVTDNVDAGITVEGKCPNCGQTDSNYLTSEGSCWEIQACFSRALPPFWLEADEIMCLTTDEEQMYVALKKIMGITGHDHNNPIFEICIEAMPPRKN